MLSILLNIERFSVQPIGNACITSIQIEEVGMYSIILLGTLLK